jgi:hypothetical protein
MKGEYYLVVFVNRLDVFEVLEDAGDALIHATIEWGGV